MAAHITLFTGLLLVISLYGIPVNACTTISATTITSNTTWGVTGSPPDSCYVISNSITISAAATLTIQPGTVLYFASGTSLIVGGTSSAGRIQAIGTAASPIVFSSLNAQHGGWVGLDFRDFSDFSGFSSTLDRCVIKKGGGSGSSGAMIKVASSTGLILTNSLVSENRNNAMSLASAPVTITGNTFRDSIGSYPVVASPRDAQALFANNTFVPGNGVGDAIFLLSVTVSESCALSLPDPGFCYLVEGGDTSIQGVSDPVISIAPGTLMKFSTSARWLVGNTDGGGLQTRGVVFTSTQDDTLSDLTGDGATTGAPGQWRCIFFGGSALTTSYLDSCVVRFAGQSENAGLRVLRTIALTRNVIRNNNGYGLSVESATVTGGTLSGNLIRDNTSYEVAAYPLPMGNIVPQNTIMPSATGQLNGYFLYAGTVSLTAHLPKPQSGFCYVWDSGDSSVQGPTDPILSIAAGTIIKSPSGARLLIGNTDGGGLQARGVVFTSTLDDTVSDLTGDGPTMGTAGQWRAIFLGGSTLTTSYLDSCVIRYAGQSDNAALRVLRTIAITRNVIRNNTGYGLSVEGTAVTAGTVAGNLIRDNTSYEVAAYPLPMGSIVPQNTIMPSATGQLNGYFLYAGTVSVSAHLPKPQSGFCYVWESGDSSVQGAADPILSIALGTIMKSPSGARLLIGNTDGGGLQARGVVFTSTQDDTLSDLTGDGPTSGAPGQWRCIYFGGSALPASSLDSCVIRYAGQSDNAALRAVSSVGLTRNVIRTNTGYGLSVEGTAVTAVGVTGNLIRDNTSYEVAAYPLPMGKVVSQNTILASVSGQLNGYLVYAGTISLSAHLPKPQTGFCYVWGSGDSRIQGATDPVLTIAHGTVIKFPAGARLLVGVDDGGAIHAKGVVFTSTADDTLGDTTADGVSSGAAGQWRGLYYGSQATAASVLSCCTIRFAGATSARAIEIVSSDPNFAYVSVVTNTGDGFYVSGATATPTMYGCTITGNTDQGVEVVGNAVPMIRHSNLQGNAGAIRTNSTTAIVDAIQNYWGSATGPADPSFGPPDQNAGSGAVVSDYVRYRPWLAAASTPACNFNVAVSLVHASTEIGNQGVVVRWAFEGLAAPTRATVERRTTETEWEEVSVLALDHGSFVYSDPAVHPEMSYGYRLKPSSEDVESEPVGEVWIRTPPALKLALHGAAPNPVHGVPFVSLSLPDGAPAILEAFDISGRRVAHEALSGLGPGVHTVRLASPRLAPGRYLLRLTHGGRSLKGAFVVLR